MTPQRARELLNQYADCSEAVRSELLNEDWKGENMNNEPPYLHLYAQKYQHENAEIIGNRQALMNLWDALHDVLDGMEGRSCQIEVFTNDGEGYSLSVRCVESNFQELPLPYTEKWEQELP